MQITIGTVSLTGSIPAEGVQQFRVVSESQLQQVLPIGAENVSQFLLGNKKLTWAFAVQREHVSPESAAYFCLQHEEQFPVQGLLIYGTDAGELYSPGAVAVVTQMEFAGATTTHTYRITSGGSASSNATGTV